MQLHCLGTAGYHPNETRHTSCYFLPSEGIILDAGTGLFRVRDFIQTETLDIILSHAHLDHIAGLTFLLDVLYEKNVRRLRIWGQSKKLDAIRAHLFSELIFPVGLEHLDLDLQWRALDELTEIQLGDCNVDWRAQQHPGGSLGFRLQWTGGCKLMYLTDTVGSTETAFLDWASGANLMLHECYFANKLAKWAETTGHTWSDRLVEIIQGTAAQHVLITHLNPLDPHPEAIVNEVATGLDALGVDAVQLSAVELGAVELGAVELSAVGLARSQGQNGPQGRVKLTLAEDHLVVPVSGPAATASPAGGDIP